jgi:hypothetical protein
MSEGQPSPPTPSPPAPAASDAPAAPAPRRSWLRENRLKVALGIALAECIFVALEEDFSRVTVIVIAIPIILFWLLAGRTLDSEVGREISWILAMSQALAVVAAIVAILIPAVALVLAGVFGAVAAYLLYHDRPDQSTRSAR